MVVGREAELKAVEAFLDAPGGGALVLEGEAGIGKTTVWRAAQRGVVLESSPGAAESRLTFAGLADLLDGLQADVFDGLPPPQRRALDVALLRADSAGTGPDQRAVATALLSILRRLAEAGPVLIAVDDLQWLDAPSWRVLDYARRRLKEEPVKFLLAQRLEAGTQRSLDDAQGLRIGPLNVAALHDVLRQELGKRFPRPTVVRVAQASAGNPFFAIELGRAILDRGEPLHAPGPLPVPDNLRALLEGRLQKLPVATRAALLAAASLARPTVDVVPRDELAPAEQARIVRVDERGHVRFAHPLLATAVYGFASPAERRAMHADLAARVDGEERARHLALATAAPDDSVAAALLAAAVASRNRGAPDTAIELLELACELTPPDSDALRVRRLELGRLLAEVGDPQQARAVLARLVDDAPAGPLRARALVLLAWQEEWARGGEAAIELCEQALAEAGDDVELLAEIHAGASRVSDNNVARKLAHAQSALAATEGRAVNPALEAYALLAFAEAAFYAGQGIASDVFERAAGLEQAGEGEAARLLHRVHHYADVRPSERLRGILAIYADELDLARAEFERELEIAAEYGDDVQSARSLARLAIIEHRAGDWHLADARLQEMAAVLARSGQESGRQWIQTIRAALDAHAGRFDTARAAAEGALALASDAFQEADARAALGFIELSLGRHEAARMELDRVRELEAEIGLREPGLLRYHGDRIETLLSVGALAEAEAALTALEQVAARPWALAVAARSRALVLAARGDLASAGAAVDEALAVSLAVPFERARTLLVKGRLQRRRKERLLAKATLEQAIDLFERLGAPTWAEQALTELQRVGLRRAAGGELTPSEQRVAALAAVGLTNREIADRIFVSPKTVEANLARVYRKLGIRSRAELGARMAQT